MKRLLTAVLVTAIVPSFLWARNVTMDGPMTDSNAALGVATTSFYTLNTDDRGVDYLSLQIAVGSGTYAAQSFTDGGASTGALTVVSYLALSSAAATTSAVVKSTQGLVGQQVFIAGQTLYEGKDFTATTNTGITACNISDAIKANTVYLSTCTGATSVIGSTSPTYGARFTGLSIQSSSPTALSSGTFTGGQDNQWFSINGTQLFANKDFWPLTSNAATATSIASAINANTATKALVAANADTGAAIVTSTATSVGPSTNYAVVSSSKAALLPNGAVTVVGSQGTAAMTGGAVSAYAFRGSNIAIANHGFPKSLGVWISTGSGVALTYSSATVGGANIPLPPGTTVYVIPVDANTIQLANSSTMSVAGIPIVFSSSRTNTAADTFTLNVAPIAGVPQWGVYASNDGSRYTQIISTYTVPSYVGISSSTFYDIGSFDYKWLGLQVAGPTNGAVTIKTTVHGEQR